MQINEIFNNNFIIMMITFTLIIGVFVMGYLSDPKMKKMINKHYGIQSNNKFVIRNNRFCEAISQNTNEFCKNYKVKGEKYCYSHCKSKKYKPKINNIDNFTKFTCGVCLENKRKATFEKLKCGHNICKTCLSKWKQRSHTCPFCRCSI
jgi:hypothetical protein